LIHDFTTLFDYQDRFSLALQGIEYNAPDPAAADNDCVFL
jgi:hypothetical protein